LNVPGLKFTKLVLWYLWLNGTGVPVLNEVPSLPKLLGEREIWLQTFCASIIDGGDRLASRYVLLSSAKKPLLSV